MSRISPNKINFVSRLEAVNKQNEKDKKRIPAGPLLCIISVLVVALAGGFCLFQIHIVLNPQLEPLLTYSQNADNISAYAAAQALTRTEETLSSELENLNSVADNVNSFPQLDESVYGAVDQCAGQTVTVTSFSYLRSDGTVTIEGYAGTQLETAAFVKRLREQSAFSGIAHYGYGEVVSGGGVFYGFSVTCLLASAGGDQQ